MFAPGDRPNRVLVVDDESSVLRYVERVLQQGGYDPTLALGSAAALALAPPGAAFDLLLTDLIMPEMCGDELSKILHQRIPTLKTLYLTGFSDRLFRIRSGLWANEAFVEKPVSATRLQEAVSQLLYRDSAGPTGQ